MLWLIVALVVILGPLAVILWTVTRAEPNSDPALGTNNPYPENLGVLGPGEDTGTFLPTAVISEAESLRRDAHRLLIDAGARRRTTPARSWMEEPGAMEAAGLVDRSTPSEVDEPD